MGYMPALDGLRAFAVFAVIAYHLNLSWAQGGLLGVNLFFVLSGYLISNILLMQWDASGSIDLKDFLLRRARRLLPALFMMLVGVMLWVMIYAPDRISSFWYEALAAVTYTSNWYLILHEVSYFETFGPPSPFGHLWTLAVEGQFYFLWPILLGWGLRFIPERKWVTGATLVVALISVAAMALIYVPGLDPSRVYYGTDTRVFDLLIGASLAMIWPSRKAPVILTGRNRQVLDVVGSIGLLVVLFMIGMTHQYQDFLYRGGLFLFSVAAACLVAALSNPASYLSKIFSWSPLRWLGKCSYGIYLWHYPVITLTGPAVNTGGVIFPQVLLQVTASIILAALSLYLIEQPARYGKLEGILVWGSSPRGRNKVLFYTGKISIGLLLAFTILSVTPNDTAQTSAKDLVEAGIVETSTANEVDIERGETPTTETSTTETIPAIEGEEITAIGDSLLLGIETALEECLPGIVVDAQQSRQMNEAYDVISELEQNGKIGEIVVLELGTNGPFTEKQLAEVLDALGKCEKVLLVNTRVPKPWETVVNETMEDVATAYSNVDLLDWYTASAGHDEYFYSDGVHLNKEGAAAYMQMIEKALTSNELAE